MLSGILYVLLSIGFFLVVLFVAMKLHDKSKISFNPVTVMICLGISVITAFVCVFYLAPAVGFLRS